MATHSLDLAYLAGLFDGEGSISVSNCKRSDDKSRNPSLTVNVQVRMTDKKTVKEFHDRWGGSFYIQERLLPCKHVYGWVLNSRQALPFLHDILPYLRLKKKQAGLVIAYYSMVPVNYRGRTLNATALRRNERFHRRMRKLNGVA